MRSRVGRLGLHTMLAAVCVGVLSLVLSLAAPPPFADGAVADGAVADNAVADGPVGGAGAAGGELSFQPVLGMPVTNPKLIGASPGEAPGEVWATGGLGSLPATVEGHSIANAAVLLRYTNQSGAWQAVPVLDAQGNAPDFAWSGAQVTPAGGVVLEGTAGSGSGSGGGESILTRDPGGPFVAAPVPSAAAAGGAAQPLLQSGETLFPASGPPLVAALDEGGGHTGALIAPVWVEGNAGGSAGGTGGSAGGTGGSAGGTGTGGPGGGTGGTGGSGGAALGPGVLDYDGDGWRREPLCAQDAGGTCTPPSGASEPLAIAARSPTEAWLLARVAGRPVLFRRVLPPDGEPLWEQVEFASGLLSPGGVPAEDTVSPAAGGPILTPTSQGVWVDLAISAGAGHSASATLLAAASSPGSVLGTWCYPTSLCPAGTPSLGAALPGEYDSFAWPGAGAGDLGTRIVTGLPEGALLRLGVGAPATEHAAFAYVAGGSAGVGSEPGGGAAFDTPQEGWLGGTSPPIHVTASPDPTQLRPWPTPFRSPLLAIAAQPGVPAGSPAAQALAVGANGEVGRYLPGEGWTAEFLYNSNGERQTPNLRGVAWPEAERAYAVGDNGAMWLWQASTGQWEQDPAAPIGLRAQLTAIAFSPVEPSVGYAVGKQGVLLAYDKSWTQQPLPPGLEKANFTSVAFAGSEAIATYRMLSSNAHEVGGLIVNDGSGWRVDESAQALIGQLAPVLSRVAGLPDGGAVAAGPGVVIERDLLTSPWRYSSAPLPEAANISALAAFREGSAVRALASIDTGGESDPANSLVYELIDNPAGPAFGQYGQLLGADPLPSRGFLLRESDGGWRDEEREDWPATLGGEGSADLPGWPDAVLGLLVDQSGDQGWAVGGQTGADLALYGLPGAQTAIQTAGVMRYGAGPAPPSTAAPIATPAGQASFAVAGDSQCATACAPAANERIGPDAWLSGALTRANQIAGLHAFLYTGGRIVAGQGDAYTRELAAYAGLLGGAGPLPVYAAITPAETALGALAPAGSVPAGTPGPPPGSADYAFDSPGSGGTVRVVALDLSQPEPLPGEARTALCPVEFSQPADQLQWLCSQLHFAKAAGIPVIVMGNAGITAAAAGLLLSGGASAYVYDSPEENLHGTLGPRAEAIPEYGSGTLGYVVPPLHDSQEFFGASGFLLVSLDVAHRNALTNRAPATASLIPNIGQLGLEAADGTQLRRSQVGLFNGLARRPAGGEEKLATQGNLTSEAPDPYTPIPESCTGPNCSQFIAPAYSFSSSNPDIGDFVESDPNSTNPRAVLLGADGKPVPSSASGLFCAYNAGTTTVTLAAGGLSYSEQVTVQAGSVARPCGTTPLRHPPAAEAQTVVPPPAPTPPAPAPLLKPGLTLAPPSPAPPVAHPQHPVPHPPVLPAALLPLLVPPAAPQPLRAALPPPAPQPARPTPPSGSSQVTQPVGVAEDEREQEQAVDVVHNMSAYDPRGGSLPPWSPVALIVIAAAAGSALRRPGRSPRLARVRVDDEGT